MKILVTGSSGFVGGAIVELLLRHNFEVYALSNQHSALTINPLNESKCRVLSADIRNFETLKDLSFAGELDAVIHSAGLAHQFDNPNEKDFWDINVEGTKNIAELAVLRAVKHLILISSVAVYGNSSENTYSKDLTKKGLTENSKCQPEGIYARTKFESEQIARKICEQHQINLTVLRLATVIGENDRGNVFRLIKAIDKRRFVWIGKGENYKSLIYKGDVARACLKILEEKKNGTEIFNVTAEPVKMKVIVEEIYRGLNKKNRGLSISPRLLKGLFQINKKTFNVKKVNNLSGTVQKWLADDIFSGEKFKKTYNFEVETSVREAVLREVQTFLKLK